MALTRTSHVVEPLNMPKRSSGGARPVLSMGPTATPHATPVTHGKTGWEVNCDCGFIVRDFNQKELVQITQLHVKGSHSKVVGEKDVLGMAKPVKA